MKIVVASKNPVKLRAVEQAFRIQFAGENPELISISVDSGVGDQPESDAETLRGARNRVEAARAAIGDADYWVGLEGGLEILGGRMIGFAWMAVANGSGYLSETRSATLPLPPEVQALVAGGMELGEANDRVFATVNSKQGGGAFGLLTDGLYTREGIYTETLVLALVPFVHPLWRKDRQ